MTVKQLSRLLNGSAPRSSSHHAPVSKDPCDTDFALYAARYRIECFFNRLKHDRAVATRYAKRARNFAGLIYLAATTL